MELKERQAISSFISKEAKEYVCVCGYTGMHPKRIYFDNELSSTVDLQCDYCSEGRTVEMDYTEEIIYGF